MTPANSEPSDKVPETVATALEESSDNQLKEITDIFGHDEDRKVGSGGVA